MEQKQDVKSNSLSIRPPVVVVLGHVDHGKTTLLDAIRKTNVVVKESGGITQHIGAYQIEVPQEPKSRESEANRGIPRQARDDFTAGSRKITFIDTPGHEAFSQMRSRGAKVADIAILVIAAEEGIKPQTKEVIEYIKKENIPTIVALNKMDKPQANPEKVIGELEKEGLIVEERGGKIPCVKISAKEGTGLNELLEMILLVAEMEELKTDIGKPGSGVVIESYLDSKRGATATFLVMEGILEIGQWAVCGDSYGKIKILEDFQGKQIEQAIPAMPVKVLGLNKAPIVGERFSVVENEESASAKATADKEVKKGLSSEAPTNRGEGGKQLNLLLKADVYGSLEAILESLKNLDLGEVGLNILKSEVGDVSESDIKIAYPANALIIGFRVKVPTNISNLANRNKVKIKTYEVIYELFEDIKKQAGKLLEPEITRQDLGKLQVLAIFRKEKSRMIIGGKVIEGKIVNKTSVDVIRPASPAGGDEEKIASGKIVQLQHNKQDMAEVEKGREAGILFEGEPVIEEGDILEVYKKEAKKREL
jgi:translation initiation factor IF-2